MQIHVLTEDMPPMIGILVQVAAALAIAACAMGKNKLEFGIPHTKNYEKYESIKSTNSMIIMKLLKLIKFENT